MIKQDPDNALAYLSRGAANMRIDRADDAVADYDAAIGLAPKNPKSFHLRGLAHEKAGDNAKALADFDTAIEINPEYAAAYNSRSILQSNIGEEEKAVEDMKIVTGLMEKQVQEFSNDNNIWRSAQLGLEASGIADVMDR